MPEPPSGAAGLAARAIVRTRYLVVAFWAGLAVFVSLELPTVREAQVGSLGDLVPRQSDAIDAEVRSSELFRFPLLSRTLVVQRDPDGLDLPEQARIARRAVALNRGSYPELRRVGGAIAVTNLLGRPPFSRERSTTAITYLFFPPEVGPDDRTILAERFLERRAGPGYDGFAGVTGTLAARRVQSEQITDSLPLVEAATVLLVTLVVGLHFRAVGAPLATLLAVAASYLVSIRLIAWVGQKAGVSVPSEVEPVIVVLLFGVVTDYSIFFLSRVRRRMVEGDEPRTAAVRGTAELLPIIVTAGLTVVAASGALAIAELGFLQAFGPGMAMAVLFGLLVAITLIPAMLAIGGRRLFWPRMPVAGTEAPSARDGVEEEPERPRRSRVLRAVVRRPLVTALACTALLLAAATGVLRLELGNPLIRGLPQDAPARVAYLQASQGFAPGILSPTVVVVEGRGITRRRRELRTMQSLLERQRGVAEVVGPAEQPTGAELGAVLSRTGNAARFFVVLGTNPLGARAIHDLRRIRERMPRLLDAAGLPRAEVSYAGDTALASETIDKTVADLRRVGPAAVALVVLILAIFLRALVAPLYLVAASVLALLASLGVATYVLQDVIGYGEITYYVPFAAAVLLVSLGSDYNVFLAGRIWEEARRRPLREAVAVAGARASTPITIAGLVLAGSFGLLALVPIRPFRELAFTVGVGLLIDAFVVRTVLVPALISLVGYPGGWPGRRLRRRKRRASAS